MEFKKFEKYLQNAGKVWKGLLAQLDPKGSRNAIRTQ